MMLFSALSILSAPAHASCAGRSAEFAPPDGAVDVPVDVTPVIFYDLVTREPEDMDDLVLMDWEGREVPTERFEVASDGRERYARLVPLAHLSPGRFYTVDDGIQASSFTTGDGLSRPPATASIAAIVPDAYAPAVDCSGGVTGGNDRFAVVQVAANEEDDAGWYEALVWLTVPSTVSTGSTVLSPNTLLYISEGGCVSNLESILDAEDVTVQIRAVSPAGDPGDWSEAETVSLPWPEAPDCAETPSLGDKLGLGGCASDGKPGCAARPGGLFGGAWLIGLLLIGRRR